MNNLANALLAYKRLYPFILRFSELIPVTFALPEFTGQLQSAAMSTLNNSVRLTGFLGNAPEIKVTENQKKLAKISLATKSYRKNADGERVPETTWHQIVLWEKQAELAEKYLEKGSKITLEGRLTNRYYTDKDGIKRYATEIVVNEIEFMSKNGQN